MAKYILFDTETTGIDKDDRIIQIGGMIVHNKDNIEVYDELCSTEVDIKLEAMETHNITPNMIEDKPPFSQTKFFQKLLEFNNSENYLIAHNIKFDLSMLEKEGFENNYTLIDTLKCAKHLFSDLPNHRLQYIRYALKLYEIELQEAEKLNITIKAHDAIGDVLVMKLFLSKLVSKAKELYPSKNPMVVLSELTTKPVLVKTLRFGKYKGKALEDIAKEDMGYLQWLYNNMEDIDDDLKYTIEYYSK